MSKYTEQLEHCGCSCAKAGLNEIAHLRGLIARASEELRLIESKDCGAIYDVGLRSLLRQEANGPSETVPPQDMLGKDSTR